MGQIVSLFLVLPLFVRVLRLNDLTIVVFAAVSLLIQALLYFFAEDKNTIMATVFFNLLSSLFSQPLRSSMTKIVGPGGKESKL